MKLWVTTIAAALVGIASPARAACTTETELRADPRWKDNGCHHCVINRVDVGPGTRLRWNGVPLSLATIGHYVAKGRHFNPAPFTALFIRPAADCGLLARVRATMEEAAPCDPWCSFALVDTPPPPRPRRRSRR